MKGIQYAAMIRSQKNGKLIAADHPEIADWYKDKSMTLGQISDQLDIQTAYNLSHSIAVAAVDYAILILIPDEDERAEIAKKHHQIWAAKRYKRDGLPMTIEDSRRGHQTLVERVGQEGMRKISLAGVVAQGNTPYTGEEIDDFKGMCSDPEYLHKTGRNRGLPDMQKIADVLNGKYHDSNPIRKSGNLASYKSKRF